MIVREEIIGRARLLLGDCRDILPTLGKVDAVVTDPPYGIGAATSGHVHGGAASPKWKAAKRKDYGAQNWDAAPAETVLIEAVRAAGRWCVMFGGNYYDSPATPCWLVWDKEANGNLADCELAWTNLPKAVRRIRYLWNGFARESGAQRGDHPTQKPLEVMRWCISHLPEPNDLILDPFMGSGTTGVAAIQMGKSFIGIEREERYFEAACRRIREANGDDVGPLFGEQAA